MVVIGVAAAVILIGGGFLWFGRATSFGSEDPELARKQWEVERSRTPSGGGGSSTAPPVAPTGMSPGRDAELAAREQRANGQ